MTTDQATYEAETIGAEVNGRKVTIAELRKVFDSVQNPDDWKAPWAAAVPHQIVDLVLAAVEFYHADTPRVVAVQQLTGKVILEGNGYQAW